MQVSVNKTGKHEDLFHVEQASNAGFQHGRSGRGRRKTDGKAGPAALRRLPETTLILGSIRATGDNLKVTVEQAFYLVFGMPALHVC